MRAVFCHPCGMTRDWKYSADQGDSVGQCDYRCSRAKRKRAVQNISQAVLIIDLQLIKEILLVNLITVVVFNMGKVVFKISLEQSTVINLQLAWDIGMVNADLPTHESPIRAKCR
jgi:hypothetical protein